MKKQKNCKNQKKDFIQYFQINNNNMQFIR